MTKARRKKQSVKNFVNNPCRTAALELIDSLSTGYQQVIHRLMHNRADKALIEAWHRYARTESLAGRKVGVLMTKHQGFNPLGNSCVVAAALGYLRRPLLSPPSPDQPKAKRPS